MTCPVCGGKTKVIDTYATIECVYRHRRCVDSNCGYKFKTEEVEVDLKIPSRWKYNKDKEKARCVINQ